MKIKCRTCNNVISVNAKACPSCGDIDPFYLKAIKKLKQIDLVTDTITAIIGIIIVYNLYGKYYESSPYDFGIKSIIVIIICIVIQFFLRKILKSHALKYYKKSIDLIDDLYENRESKDIIDRAYRSFL